MHAARADEGRRARKSKVTGFVSYEAVIGMPYLPSPSLLVLPSTYDEWSGCRLPFRLDGLVV